MVVGAAAGGFLVVMGIAFAISIVMRNRKRFVPGLQCSSISVLSSHLPVLEIVKGVDFRLK